MTSGDLHSRPSAGSSTSARQGAALQHVIKRRQRGTALEAAPFDVTGAKTSSGALYATDGGWFTVAGITPLICGPGDLDQAHQPNEYIRRPAFDPGPAMIAKVISRLCCIG